MKLSDYAKRVRIANQKWWTDLETGQPINRNVGELLMLTVSELAEAMEGHRKNLMDDHIRHRKMFDMEIVDTFIRLFDIAADIPELDEAFEEKMAYNAVRADHTNEARLAANGKKY